MQKRFQELLNQARMETDVKIQECEELRMHVGFQIVMPQCLNFYFIALFKGRPCHEQKLRMWQLTCTNGSKCMIALLRTSLHMHNQVKSRNKEKNFTVQQR